MHVNFLELPYTRTKKFLNEISWKIRQIKIQQIFYIKRLQNSDLVEKGVLQYI